MATTIINNSNSGSVYTQVTNEVNGGNTSVRTQITNNVNGEETKIESSKSGTIKVENINGKTTVETSDELSSPVVSTNVPFPTFNAPEIIKQQKLEKENRGIINIISSVFTGFFKWILKFTTGT